MNWFNKIAEYEHSNQIERLSKENPYPFKEWFGENGRVYIPFFPGGEQKQQQEGIDEWVEKELTEKGYQITDYRKGYAAQGNRVFRIGKILNNLKQKRLTEIQNQYQNMDQEQDPVRYQIFSNQLQEETRKANSYYDDLINTFINSSFRTHQSAQKNSKFYVVISQNPHDIAQMSTNRQWTSCMDLGGGGREPGSRHSDIFCEVRRGGLVAYLIRADDIKIEDPLARIHIRRFDNKDGQSIAIPEGSVYGNEIKGFEQTVKSWLDQRQGDITPGVYERQGGEYSDTFEKSTFVSPSNIDDVLSWLKGEGKDAQYSTWSVIDLVYNEYEDNDRRTEMWGDYFYEPQEPIDNESQTFNTKEEAKAYHDEKTKIDQRYGEYAREALIEMNQESEWMDRDEETGEWEEKRFWIRENKTDHRSSMTNDAIKTILKAPKGQYSPKVLEEIKQMLFGGNISYSPRKKEFLEAYPELFSNEEISKMKDTDQLEIFKKLSPERQEQQRQDWTGYMHNTLDNPQVFVNENVQKAMRERDRATDITTRVRGEDSVGMFYSLALTDWLFNPLREIFKPIPEPIIQKLVNFGQNFLQEDSPLVPYKNMPGYDNEILGNMVHVLSTTGSDTPTVQRFYKQLLPLWEDNRKTYYDKYTSLNIESLGRAIGKLGENGREFLPFIENKIIEEKQALDKLEKSITPDKREWSTTKDLLKRVYKKIERLYFIKKSIDPNNNDPMTYKWYNGRGNWYKQAKKFYLN